jgi:hypothetical protein
MIRGNPFLSPQRTNTTIFGVYFICCIGKYKEIVAEQIEIMRSSGLLGKTDTIFCFICQYEDDIMRVLDPYMSKLKIISTTENLYEKFALNNFRDHIPNQNEYYLFYIHSKGVSREAETFHDVRKHLDYITLEKHEVCLFWLDHGYDAVGSSLSLYPTLHFSGNFWWTKSSHLRKLPTEVRNTYLGPEMYICCDPDGRYISICADKKQDLPDHEILKQSTCVPHNNIRCRNMGY